MMSKNSHFIAILCLIALILTACSGSNDYHNIDKELNALDVCLNDTEQYDAKRQKKINELKSKLASTPASDVNDKWKTYMALGENYRAFCSDSSAYYYYCATQLADKHGLTSQSIDSKINLASARGAAGLFTISFNTLNSIDTTLLSPSQHIAYALVGRQLYSYMDEYSKGPTDFEEHRAYTARGLEYEQYLINNLEDDNPYRKFLYAQKLHRDGDNASARKITQALLQKLNENENLFGMTAYLMAQIAGAEGNDEEYGRYLAIASRSDVKAAVKETMALPALAKWLYNKGEVDRAYIYINASLKDAMASNARMRTVEISSLLPLVDNAYRKKMSSSRDELMIYLALLVLLFVVSGGLLIAVFRNMKRLSAVNRKLDRQTKVQESYIGHFIGLCSSYSDKLESMRKLVNRKITAGQTDELLKMLKSGKYTDPENDDFFKVFDDTFLDLYPTFIDELNALLRADSQISYKKGAPLTTELRIYAFVRLGVEESVNIARILHCSVSTIYTYRNRMRGRAINREKFEADVLKIGHDEMVLNI